MLKFSKITHSKVCSGVLDIHIQFLQFEVNEIIEKLQMQMMVMFVYSLSIATFMWTQ